MVFEHLDNRHRLLRKKHNLRRQFFEKHTLDGIRQPHLPTLFLRHNLVL